MPEITLDLRVSSKSNVSFKSIGVVNVCGVSSGDISGLPGLKCLLSINYICSTSLSWDESIIRFSEWAFLWLVVLKLNEVVYITAKGFHVSLIEISLSRVGTSHIKISLY